MALLLCTKPFLQHSRLPTRLIKGTLEITTLLEQMGTATCKNLWEILYWYLGNQWALTNFCPNIYILNASIWNGLSKKSHTVIHIIHIRSQVSQNHQSLRHSSSWMLRAFNSSSYLVFFPTISRRRVSPSKAVALGNAEHFPPEVSQAESKEIISNILYTIYCNYLGNRPMNNDSEFKWINGILSEPGRLSECTFHCSMELEMSQEYACVTQILSRVGVALVSIIHKLFSQKELVSFNSQFIWFNDVAFFPQADFFSERVERWFVLSCLRQVRFHTSFQSISF